LYNELKGHKIIFNFASIADIGECSKDPKKSLETNIIGLVNLLNICKKIKIKKFIYSSSVYVNSDKGGFYRISKKAAEEIIDEYAAEFKECKFLTLRYGSLYGKNAQDWNSISKYIKEIIKNKKINFRGSKNDIREYIHIEDAARVTVDLSLEVKTNKKYMLTGNQSIRGYELISLIKEISGINAKVSYKNMRKKDHYSVTPYRIMSNKITKITLNETIDLGEGIKEVFENFDS